MALRCAATRWGTRLALVALGAALAPQASAQSAEPEDESAEAVDARELFRRGAAAYSVGNYELAIQQWEAAYRTDPRPRIQYNLAQAYERLGRLSDAIAALETYVGAASPEDSQYADANARLGALRQRMALTGLHLVGAEEGGQILIDGTDWGRTPRPDRIPLAPGSHQVVIRWLGRPDFTSTVLIPAGQSIELEVQQPAAPVRESEEWTEGSGPAEAPASDLAPEPAGPEPSDAAVAPAPVSEPAPRDEGGGSALPWVIAGSAAAAAGIGALAWGIERHSALSDCDRSGFACLEEDTVSRQRNVGLALGSVLIAGGAAVMLIGLLRGGESEGRAAACGVGLGSVQCGGRF